jgi:hypothetical protein
LDWFWEKPSELRLKLLEVDPAFTRRSLLILVITVLIRSYKLTNWGEPSSVFFWRGWIDFSF